MKTAWTHVTTISDSIANKVNDAVPAEHQIKRARTMVGKLDETIETCKKKEIQTRVEADELQRKIEEYRGQLEKQETDLKTMRADLDTDQEVFTYSGKTYSRRQVELDLERKLSRLQNTTTIVNNLENLHQAKVEVADALLAKSDQIAFEQNQLRIEIDNLVARQELLDVMRMSGDFDLEETELAEVNKIVSNLDTRLQVAEQLAMSTVGEIKLEQPTEDLLAKIDAQIAMMD